jgi:GntR family transcriptional regulator
VKTFVDCCLMAKASFDLELPQLRAGRPAYRQIEFWLADAIASGQLLPGDRLPGEVELAGSLGVSRMTLRGGLAELESRGMLRRELGRHGGTFVTRPKIECDLTGVAGLTEQLRRHKLRASARLVSAARTPAKRRVANALGLAEGDDVYEVVRVRLAAKEPIALERSFFPARILPGFLERRLTGSLYSLLERAYGQRPVRAYEALEPVTAVESEAGLLGIEPGAPLMLIERTAYAASGVVLEFARDLFRGDRTLVTFWSGEPAPANGTPTDPQG